MMLPFWRQDPIPLFPRFLESNDLGFLSTERLKTLKPCWPMSRTTMFKVLQSSAVDCWVSKLPRQSRIWVSNLILSNSHPFSCAVKSIRAVTMLSWGRLKKWVSKSIAMLARNPLWEKMDLPIWKACHLYPLFDSVTKTGTICLYKWSSSLAVSNLVMNFPRKLALNWDPEVVSSSTSRFKRLIPTSMPLVKLLSTTISSTDLSLLDTTWPMLLPSVLQRNWASTRRKTKQVPLLVPIFLPNSNCWDVMLHPLESINLHQTTQTSPPWFGTILSMGFTANSFSTRLVPNCVEVSWLEMRRTIRNFTRWLSLMPTKRLRNLLPTYCHHRLLVEESLKKQKSPRILLVKSVLVTM
mmetsp:Transcript_22241/g.33089  ORF Transcript_22241/g.33089 Transcript_22241/m.33089 type:complete len:353 (-) Transcript_22241:4580-5638(-)